MDVTELTTKNAPLWRNRVRSLVESSLPVRERKILRAKLVRKQRGKVLTQSDIRLRETRRTILSKVVSAVQKVQRLYNRMRMTKYALLPGESASRHELSWMRGCSVDVRTDCQGQRLGAYQREVGHRVGRTGDSDDVFLACVGEGSGQSSHPVSIELRMNQPSFQAKRSVAGSATPAPSRAHFSTAKVTGSRRRHLSCQCMHTAHFCVLRASHPNPAAALAEHLQRQHERLAHAQVKATMAPGPVAARRFASTYLYPGAWSAVSTLDMLSACPPNATHTGPDGEALRRVPLTVDVDAEFIGCYGSHGPSSPFGPAAFGRTSLAMARLMISHAHGTAIYGRDPALMSEEEDEDDDELVRFDKEASSAMRALKAAAAATSSSRAAY